MKRFILFSLILLSVGMGSCKKFLAESSQDEMRPGSIEDLNALMFSDAYPYIDNFDNFDLLTDDIQSNGIAIVNSLPFPGYVTPQAMGTPIFTYNPTMFDANNVIPIGANLYQNYYKRIKGCNVVIDHLDKVNGSQQTKNAVLGQCLFLRAYYYFKLVTIYSLPYSAQGVNPEVNLGVPLILSSKVRDGGIPRPTMKTTYDQIEADLKQALVLLKENYVAPSAFRVSSIVANALLSRFYLYRGLDGDLEKVIDAANLVISERSTLTSLSTFFNASNNITGIGIFDAANTEVLWVYGSNPQNQFAPYFPSPQGGIPPYTVSRSLLNLYQQGPTSANYGDLRYQMYFNKYFNGGAFPYSTAKSTLNNLYSGTSGFRLSEVYLNRAEALIKRFIKNGTASDRVQALADLNYLRSNRYDIRNTTYQPVSILDAQELYAFYQDERRRELALEEGHRWQDIKRWGLSVTHQYIAADGTMSTHVLPANSPLYALPIPYTALAANLDLQQNER